MAEQVKACEMHKHVEGQVGMELLHKCLACQFGVRQVDMAGAVRVTGLSMWQGRLGG